MPRFDESKSRLIPENHHQILSVFFIVASLLGVFFTLGYIVGRNSPLLIGPSTASANESILPRKSSAKLAAPPSTQPATPAPVQSGAVKPSPPVETAKPVEPAKPAETAKPVETAKRAEAAKPVETAKPAETAKPVETAKVIPPPAAPPKRVDAPPIPAPVQPPALSASADRPPGMYLQLVATNKQGVDLMVDALRKSGFPAVSAAISDKPGWYRALVGPLSDSAISTTRAALEAAGFPGDQAIKRSF